MTHWHEPVSGFQYETHSLNLPVETQAERLTACGIVPTIFGADVDPAFFIGLAIHAGIDSGISAEGNINMLQRLIQHRPAKLGEMLTVKGEIKSVTDVPRGQRVETEVWFEDAAGERVISCPRTSLRPQAQINANRGAGDKPRPVRARCTLGSGAAPPRRARCRRSAPRCRSGCRWACRWRPAPRRRR